jgi:tetratricopeptide (TPR) repeat protein
MLVQLLYFVTVLNIVLLCSCSEVECSRSELSLADSLLSVGKYHSALFIYNKQDAVCELKAGSLSNRAVCFIHIGKLDSAHDDLTIALQMNPNNAIAIKNLATVFFYKKDYDSAMWHYRTLAKITPKDHDAYYGIGITYHFQKQLDSALVYLNIAIEMSEGSIADYYASRSYVYFDLRRFQECCADLRVGKNAGLDRLDAEIVTLCDSLNLLY